MNKKLIFIIALAFLVCLFSLTPYLLFLSAPLVPAPTADPAPAEKEKPVLIQYILHRVQKQNKNFVMIMCGATGSGKSLALLRLAEQLDPTFTIERCSFKPIEFMNCVNELVEQSEQGASIVGKVIMWDELGASHSAREFMTLSNRLLNYFFQTSRHLNLIVLMSVPLLSFIDSNTRKLCHAVGEMEGINRHDKVSTAKVKMIQTNVLTSREYSKFLRYRKDSKSLVAKRMRFKLPSKELLQAYEKKKKAFTTALNKEIMTKLLRVEEKDNKQYKALSPMQEKVTELLKTNGADKVAEILEVNPSSVYDCKRQAEKKGIVFKPIWKDKHIVGHDITGFDTKKAQSTEATHND